MKTKIDRVLGRNIILIIIICSILVSGAFALADETKDPKENAKNPNDGPSKMSKGVADVAINSIELNAILPDHYSNTTKTCTSCHNDTGYPEDTDGNGIAAPYKRPHNDTIMCEYCHGANPHSIKYIQPDGSLSASRSTAATCIDCHQTGTVGANNTNFSSAYVIGNILHHSDDPNNGSLWNRPGESPFWTGQYEACLYCHNDTKHNVIALGKPSEFKGSNSVRIWGTWCGTCHYVGNSQYSNMISTMGTGKIPPEITGDVTYGNYPIPPYYDHELASFDDDACKGCHGARDNVSALMHDTTTGQGGPDCVSCHDIGTGGAPYKINVSAMNEGIHKDLNKDADDQGLNPSNKKCWACHGDHTTDYKTPAKCEDCHIGSNRNFTPNDTIPIVSEHYLEGSEIQTPGATSCYKCHNKSGMLIIANDPDSGSGAVYGGANGGNNSTSHYGKKRTDLVPGTKQYCDTCHKSYDTPPIPPESFFDVFIDIYNTDIQNHSRYETNPTCQNCHDIETGSRIHDANLTFEELTLPTSAICITCHGPGGSATIRDKSKHNGTVDCSVCHMETGKDVHPIKYLNRTGGFDLSNTEGIRCVDCHETGLYNAPAIGKFQHSDNTWNGSLWSIGAGRPPAFWDNNSANTACNYCHSDSKHNASAIGRIDAFKGSNVVNVYGTWCGSCHYKNNGQYSNMVSTMTAVGVPPEITRHATYGDYVQARDGTRYFNHSLNTYNDDRCDDCHYSGTPSSLTKLAHDVRVGGGACMECHADVDVNIAIFGKHANISRSEGLGIVSDNDCKICHFNVLTMEQMLPGYANFNNTYYCQDCHKSGGRNATQYASIPANLRVDTLSHAKANCQDCHINNNASKYHPNGPIGTAFDLVNNRMRNCYSCHYRTDGARDGIATTGLMKDPFYAPGEDHSCTACHDDYINDPNPRPALSYCNMCHAAAVHYTTTGYHFDTSYPVLDTVSITSPVTAGSPSTVRARAISRWMQIARAQYRIMDSAGTVVVRDWQEMSAEDGNFNSRQEFVVGSISTTGLSGDYRIEIKAMDGGHIAQSGAIGHDPGRPYYPDNGAWTRISTTTLRVTGVTPTPTPTWSSWINLGGLTAITPDIAEFNGRLYGSVRGYSSSSLWINSMNTGGTWTGWSPVPMDGFPGALVGAGPSIYSFNNRLYLMATGANNAIYINSMSTNGVWSGWTNLGGLTAITPDIAEFNGRLYGSVRGYSSSSLWINSMNTGGTWTGWSPVPMDGFPGALVGAGPSIYSFNNRLYLMATGANNAIYINSFG